MKTSKQVSKAIVHVSGTQLRRNWYGKELNSCIVIRPSGKQRDTLAYLVNQVKFNGETNMVFSAQPRKAARGTLEKGHGFEGTLRGFDNGIIVYLEVEEAYLQVQAKPGDSFIPFADFKRLVKARKIQVPILNPILEVNC